MLSNLGKMSRKSRLTLRNNLTKRYPAVPLPKQSSTEENGFSDSEDEDLDLGQNLEFLGVRKEDDMMSKQMKQWQDDLDQRLKVINS